MRFQKLTVEHFRRITHAEVEFAPGLNVLHGPNDLGKSTLGVALRAALLLPPTSAVADSYRPWNSDEKPVVALTFLDDTLRWWRVVKRFTENRATLLSSKDGKDFTAEAQERQVEDRLRALLGWGIPGPGGKSAQRGMPESFLANALLAAQTDSAGVLSASLEKDPGPEGKVRLTQALAALAEDPVVRHVLDSAQEEVERYFTASGRLRRGQGAKLTAASAEVKRLEAELLALQQALASSRDAEEATKRLRDGWLEAEQRAEAAARRVELAQVSERTRAEHEAAKASQQRALAALARAQQALERVATQRTALKARALQVDAARERAAAATTRARAAERTLREAEAALESASREDGAQQRALQRAALETERAQLEVEHARLEERLARAERAAQGRQLAEERAQVLEALPQAEQAVSAAAQDEQLARAILDYGEWRAANELALQAGPLRAEAQALNTQTLSWNTERMATERRADTLSRELDVQEQALPPEKQRTSLARLQHELALAEAALGGGVTVVVKPRSPLRLRSAGDEGSAEEEKLSREKTIEAERRVQLTIGDLAEVEILAGAADKRKDAEHLRRRWKSEAMPVLEAAGVRALSEVTEKLEALAGRRAEVERLKADAVKLAQRVEAAHENMRRLDERLRALPTPEQLASKRALVGALPFELLEQHFVAMGGTWESQARALLASASRKLDDARAALSTLRTRLEVLDARLADVQPDAAAETVEQARVTLTQSAAARAAWQARWKALEARQDDGQRQLRAHVTSATAALEQARAEAGRAAEALALSQRELALLEGELRALEAQTADLHLEALQGEVQRSADELARWEGVEWVDLADAQQALDAARAAANAQRDELRKAEGALSMAGGAQVRERARDLEDAVKVARANEHHLEVDAAAWRLLVDTIRAAEQTEDAGLGRALAAPVGEQFAALTKGRYPSVTFEPSLRAAGVTLPGTQAGADEVLEALSVGTKDQLATLVRLAIAVQLKAPLVLDDHLVHSDVARLGWFREALGAAARKTQVVVLTCRPEDYAVEGGTFVNLVDVLR